MEPTKLTLRNFLSYRDDVVDLEPIVCAALVGDNGAGKSSLLDALTWALFGQGTKGRDLDNYVTRGEPEGRVELEFVLRGEAYRVVRARNAAKGKSILEFFIQDSDGWRALSGKTIADTQRIIEETLRMDYRTFTSSALVLQGQSDSFTANMTDQERKEALGRILGLDLWDRLQERAREQVRARKAQVQALEDARERLRVEVSRKDALNGERQLITEELAAKTSAVEVLTQRCSQIEGQLQQKTALDQMLSEAKTELDRRQAELYTAQFDEQRIRRQTAEAEGHIRDAQGILARAEEIRGAVEMAEEMELDVQAFDAQAQRHMELSRQLQDARVKQAHWESSRKADAARIQTTLKTASEQAAVLDQVPCGESEKAACPLLGMARRASSQVQELRAQLAALQGKADPYTEKVQELEQELAAVGYDQKAHAAAREALLDVRKVARLQPELEAATVRVAEMQARIEQWQTDLDQLTERAKAAEGEIRRCEARTREIRKQLDDLLPLAGILTRTQAELAMVRNEEHRLRSELGRIEAGLELVARAEKELADLEKQSETLRKELAVYELLEEACGKKGVPALIIENAVPEIERLTNDMLARMAGGRLAIQLETQVEGKTTGTVQEVLRVTVLEEGAERPYQTYSGAERFMVDLALRVALSKFLANRAGAEIRLFALDEGLGSCDTTNRQAVMDAIQAVAEEFSKVLVITHIAELQDSFPQQMVVTKGPDGSKARLIA